MSKTAEIQQFLTELLREHKYDGSFRLPSEAKLAETFGCSKICAKGALDALRDAGFVTRRHGSGSYANFDFVRQELAGPLRRRVAILLPIAFSRFLFEIYRNAFDKLVGFGIFCHFFYFRGNEEEKNLLKYVYEQRFDGAIFYPMDETDPTAELEWLSRKNFPILLIDRYFKQFDFCTVSSNHFASSRNITQYLLELGRRKICFLSEQPTGATSIQHRLSGFESIVRSSPAYSGCYPCFYHYNQLAIFPQLIRETLTQRPADAIITTSGPFTIFVLNALKELRLVPGKDVILALYDDELALEQITDFFYIKLNQNSEIIGKTAADMFLRLLKKEPLNPRQITVHTTIELVNPPDGFSQPRV